MWQYDFQGKCCCSAWVDVLLRRGRGQLHPRKTTGCGRTLPPKIYSCSGLFRLLNRCGHLRLAHTHTRACMAFLSDNPMVCTMEVPGRAGTEENRFLRSGRHAFMPACGHMHRHVYRVKRVHRRQAWLHAAQSQIASLLMVVVR